MQELESTQSYQQSVMNETVIANYKLLNDRELSVGLQIMTCYQLIIIRWLLQARE